MKRNNIIFLTVCLFLSLIVSYAFASSIEIRKGGSSWAKIEGNDIRINGNLVGKVESDGTVRKGGSIVGKVEANGTVRKSGSIYGKIESDGTLRKGGNIIGKIESNGTIRKSGSIWGSASGCSSDGDRQKVTAVLMFFSEDF